LHPRITLVTGVGGVGCQTSSADRKVLWLISTVDHLEDTDYNPMLNSRFNRRGYGEELVGKRITVYCTEWENW